MEKVYPSNLHKLTLLSKTNVRVRKRLKEEKNGTFSPPIVIIPTNESKNKGKEQKKGDKKGCIVNKNEKEERNKETQQEKGYQNVKNKVWKWFGGVKMVAFVVYQSSIGQIVH